LEQLQEKSWSRESVSALATIMIALNPYVVFTLRSLLSRSLGLMPQDRL
jgi:hypothetical protein